MKLLSLWVEVTVKSPLILLAAITVLMVGASDVLAYGDYAGGCDNCHGEFDASPYTSLSDGSSWTDGLHLVHRNDMLGGDCNTCHTTGGRKPVVLDSSNGGDGLSAISCVGCHGRDQDGGNDSVSGGLGAGLRQHHTTAGVTTCTGCHSDAVLANYTPVGEDVLPNYYASPGTGHTIPSSSCNPSGEEDFAGTALGLDNDGDGTYDTSDANCVIPVELMKFEIE